METLLEWAPHVAGVLVLISNALLKHYDDKRGFTKVLHVIVDLLSPFTRKDSDGTLKFPLTKSRVPPIQIELEDEVVEDLLRLTKVAPKEVTKAASSLFAVLLCGTLVACSGGFTNTYHKTLSTTAHTAGYVHEAAMNMCEPVLAGCIAAKKNPCPALDSCQAARRETLRSLQTLQSSVQIALEAEEVKDVKTANQALALATQLLAEIRTLLGRYGINL